jgi:hypothetical protein
MNLDRTEIARLVAVLVTVASLAVGCSGGGSASSGSPPSQAPPSAALPAPSPSVIVASPSVRPSGSAATIELTDADRGTVVVLAVGETVSVVLHSTYWSAATSSDESVLASVGAPAVSPDPPGTCLPGIGCGTVTSVFVAHAVGRAVVSAGRTVCGEARSCSSPDSAWEAVIQVRR